MSKLISKTKIETCDRVFNPVWGCDRSPHCEYCYARTFAKRFGNRMAEIEYDSYLYFAHPEDIANDCNTLSNKLKNFMPTFLHSQFNKKFPQKAQKVFVGSMSEIRFWKKEWIKRVFENQILFPEHIFQYLTKYPYIYHRYEFPPGSWLGFTANTMKDLADGIPHIEKVRTMNLSEKYLYYICIEPILEEINPLGILLMDWVILGVETGNRKNKIIPKREWIENIVDYCKKAKMPIYLKNSLREIYPEEIKEFPEGR